MLWMKMAAPRRLVLLALVCGSTPAAFAQECVDAALGDEDTVSSLLQIKQSRDVEVGPSMPTPTPASARCTWVIHNNHSSCGYAGGDSTVRTLDAAKAACLRLGAQCNAVTCLGSACTIRESSVLHVSPSGETTYLCREVCTNPQPLHCPSGCPPCGCNPGVWDGFWYDLVHNNIKRMWAHRDPDVAAHLWITPPPTCSPMYRPSVMQGWEDSALVFENCTTPHIDYDIAHHPGPELGPMPATFYKIKLASASWMNDCGAANGAFPKCNATLMAEQADVADEERWALVFGTDPTQPNNVWTKMTDSTTWRWNVVPKRND